MATPKRTPEVQTQRNKTAQFQRARRLAERRRQELSTAARATSEGTDELSGT